MDRMDLDGPTRISLPQRSFYLLFSGSNTRIYTSCPNPTIVPFTADPHTRRQVLGGHQRRPCRPHNPIRPARPHRLHGGAARPENHVFYLVGTTWTVEGQGRTQNNIPLLPLDSERDDDADDHSPPHGPGRQPRARAEDDLYRLPQRFGKRGRGGILLRSRRRGERAGDIRRVGHRDAARVGARQCHGSRADDGRDRLPPSGRRRPVHQRRQC
jgi:hypothetical protein